MLLIMMMMISIQNIFATGCGRIEWKINWFFFNATRIQSFNHLGVMYYAMLVFCTVVGFYILFNFSYLRGVVVYLYNTTKL